MSSQNNNTQTAPSKDMWLRMERLYDLYYQKLYAYAMGMLDDEEESKDVISEVMQKVWEDWNMPKPQYPNPTSSMLYTFVRNRCLDILRRDKVRDKYAEMMMATSELTNDDEVAALEERISRVQTAVEALPEKSRRVLMCTYYKKMSYRETAEELGISDNMVRKHMIKAFSLLREVLKMLFIGYLFDTLFV